MHDRYDQELLLGFVEGELSDEQRAQFEATLIANDRLRNLVAQLVADRRALQDTPQVPTPAYVLDGIREQLERHLLLDAWGGNEEPSPRARHRWGRIVSVACLLGFVAVGAAVVVLILERSRDMWRGAPQSNDLLAVAEDHATTALVAEDGDTTAGLPSVNTTAHPPAAPVPMQPISPSISVPPRLAMMRDEPEEPDFLNMPAVTRVVDPVRTAPMMRREVAIVTTDLGATIERLHRWVRQHDHPLRALPDETMGSWELVLPTPALAALIDALHTPPAQQVHLQAALPPMGTAPPEIFNPLVRETETEWCRVTVRLQGHPAIGTASAL